MQRHEGFPRRVGVTVLQIAGQNAVFLQQRQRVLKLLNKKRIDVNYQDKKTRKTALTIAVDDTTSLRLAAAINTASIDVVRSTGAAPADVDATYPARIVDEAADGG